MECQQYKMLLQLYTYTESKEICSTNDPTTDEDDDNDDLEHQSGINFLHCKPDLVETL